MSSLFSTIIELTTSFHYRSIVTATIYVLLIRHFFEMHVKYHLLGWQEILSIIILLRLIRMKVHKTCHIHTFYDIYYLPWYLLDVKAWENTNSKRWKSKTSLHKSTMKLDLPFWFWPRATWCLFLLCTVCNFPWWFLTKYGIFSSREWYHTQEWQVKSCFENRVPIFLWSWTLCFLGH